MDAYSKKFKCVLHFNSFEERVIMYDDMTYSMLLEFVVKRFNLDPNIMFNLSFNLPVIERDITNDEDVELFIDCATNSLYDEIPHLYVRPPKVEAMIIPGPAGILQKAMLQKKADVQAGPWVSAIVYLHGQGVIASGCLGDVEKYCKNGKLELVVGVVNSCTPNSLGDMTVTLKDPTGTVGGTIHYKVFQNEADGYTKSIKVGSVLILRNVSVWTPNHHNIILT
ncbi:reverse transcriptase domain-containing protein [Tanacetum coccineum]